MNIHSLTALGAIASLTFTYVGGVAVPNDLRIRDNVDPTTKQNANRNKATLTAYEPQCRDDDDPSWAIGKSMFKDGDGQYLGSFCDNGLSSPAVNRFHCWTDVFYVERQAYYDNWHSTGQTIDCSSTQTCAAQSINLNQSCTTNSMTNDNGIMVNVNGGLEKIWGSLNLGGTIQYSHNWQSTNEDQYCTSDSFSGTCTWNDQGCHALWTADRNIRVFGYLRRSCNNPSDGVNMPNTPQRADGYYTRGMLDFNTIIPENRQLGCHAKCDDLTYPDPLPAGDLSPQPLS